jgi:hypothetical protein
MFLINVASLFYITSENNSFYFSQAQKFADQHGAELLIGIHTPTKKKKSWYLKPFGPRMSDFINKTAVGKKIQEACKQMSDSWLVGIIFLILKL